MYTNLKETRQDLRKKSDVSAQIKIMDEDKEQIMSIFVLLLFLYFLILVLVRLKLLFFSRNKIEGYQKKTNTTYTNLKETRQDLRKKTPMFQHR
jgi:hypothetical protein